MPRSPAQLQLARDRARKMLLDAALACFARQGYANTTSRDIAATAGVSLGLAYRYFKSKDQMVVAIIRQALTEVRGDVARSAASDRDPVEALIDNAFATVRANPSFWRLFHQLRLHPSGSPQIDRVIRGAALTARRQIDQVISSAPGNAAQGRGAALFAAIDGAAQHYLLDPKNYPLDAVANELAWRFRAAQPGTTSPSARTPKSHPTGRTRQGPHA